jgi:hypothetical protein
MRVWAQWLTVAVLAWVLWVDQTVYNFGDGTGKTPIVAEGAKGSFVRVLVTNTRGECEAAKQTAVFQAERNDALQAAAASKSGSGNSGSGGDSPNSGPGSLNSGPGNYKQRDRHLCSPLDSAPGR